jgi:hypothetical protein
MTIFTKNITVTTGALGGVITFIVTALNFFSGIYEFHGTWLEFSGYIMDGIGESLLNGVIVFCICGIIAYPLVKIIEKRMIDSFRSKNEKK